MLENMGLHVEDNRWEKLLPKQFTSFINQLEEDDFRDELVANVPSLITSFREVRLWEWYSSEVLENGFEIVYTGNDINAVGTKLLHNQGLPHTCLFSEQGEDFYNTSRAGIDVLTYKSYDKSLFKLTRK